MKLTKPLSQRLAETQSRAAEGYNCAQRVVLAFDDITAPGDIRLLEAAAAALGAGMGDTGQTCGCLTGAHMLLGTLRYTSPADKKNRYAEASAFNKQWLSAHQQCGVCRDLKTKAHIPCSTLIEDTITQLHNLLEQTE